MKKHPAMQMVLQEMKVSCLFLIPVLFRLVIGHINNFPVTNESKEANKTNESTETVKKKIIAQAVGLRWQHPVTSSY